MNEESKPNISSKWKWRLWLVNERRRGVEKVNDWFFLMYYYIIRLNHIKAIHVANNSKWRVNISSKEKSVQSWYKEIYLIKKLKGVLPIVISKSVK